MTNIFLCCIRGSSVGSNNRDDSYTYQQRRNNNNDSLKNRNSLGNRDPPEYRISDDAQAPGENANVLSWPNLEQVRDLQVNPVHYYGNICNTRNETLQDNRIETLPSRLDTVDDYELKTLRSTVDFYTSGRTSTMKTLGTTGDLFNTKTATIRRHHQTTLSRTGQAILTPGPGMVMPRLAGKQTASSESEDCRKMSTPINSNVEVKIPDFDLSRVANLNPLNSHLNRSPTVVALNMKRSPENSFKSTAVTHIYEQLQEHQSFRTFKPSPLPVPKILEPEAVRRVDNYIEFVNVNSEGLVKVKSFTSTYSASELQLKSPKEFPPSLRTQVEQEFICNEASLSDNHREHSESSINQPQGLRTNRGHLNDDAKDNFRRIKNPIQNVKAVNPTPEEIECIPTPQQEMSADHESVLQVEELLEEYENDSTVSNDSLTPVLRSEKRTRIGLAPMSQLSQKFRSRLDSSIRRPAVLRLSSPVPSINKERGLFSIEVSRLARKKKTASVDWGKLP